MNIAITGHTKGIGKAVYDLLKAEGHSLLGLSRPDYDITSNNIVEMVKNYDVFINNAYAPDYQTYILKSIIEEWKNQDKIIINMSSKLAFKNSSTDKRINQYIKDKQEQNKVCIEQSTKGYPRVCNLILGLVDTEMSKIFESDNKMKTTDIANFVLEILRESPVWVQQVILEVPGYNIEDIKMCDKKL